MVDNFYVRTLVNLLESGTLSISDSVLVVCGGPFDKTSLEEVGFLNVTITNLDDRVDNLFTPYAWDRQDAEDLSYPDNQFDLVIVHAGLHHCPSPHRALLEMFRVARKCALAFEARDSLTLRIAKALGFTVDYEIEAVSGDKFERGGLNNGPIPNFIYRWTERAVRHTIASYDPAHTHRFQFFYQLRLPTQRLQRTNRTALRLLSKLITPLAKAFVALLPQQCNEFAFAIMKTGRLQPWMESKGAMLQSYVSSRGRMYVFPGRREVPY
jgi:ubiquinone/menaquinone biosynthesis C-methylase UbiE